MTDDKMSDYYKDSDSSPTFTQDPHTLTGPQLAEAWARMMGWHIETRGGVRWWIAQDGSYTEFTVDEPWMNNWRPDINWSHFGICYEWMRRRGWKSEQVNHNDEIRWCWFKPGHYYYEYDPDFRTAMLLAGYEAEGEK